MSETNLKPNPEIETFAAHGHVPDTCTMNANVLLLVIMAENPHGRSPCDRCNTSREVCGGKPRTPEEDSWKDCS